jgi:O-antigen/teichoic acid export membrane protein
MKNESLTRLNKAFISGIWATLTSILLGFSFTVWLAQSVAKGDLALFNSVVDLISLSLILMTGFRSSMVVSYSQTHNDRDIINLFRYVLIGIMLLTWGLVIPYIKHGLQIKVDYLHLVGIILGLGFKVYFTNVIAMYRLYDLANKVTWLEPLSSAAMFGLCYGVLDMDAIGALFYGLTLSSLGLAMYMFVARRQLVKTQSLGKVSLDPLMISYVKRSFTAALEAGASILMIYITVLLTIKHFSVDELGDFQVVVRPILTYMTMLFVFPIYRFVLPELAVNLQQGDHEQIRLIRRWLYRFAARVSAIFFLTMLFAGKSLVLLFFPVEYASAVPVLFHFSLFFIFMMLNGYQLAYLKAHGHFTQSLLIRLAGIVALIASYYVVAQFTANVVAIIVALGLGYMVMFILASVVERRLLARLPPRVASTA